MNKVLHAHGREDWGTPPALFRALDAVYQFTLDAAAAPENTLCRRFYTAVDDALRQPWLGRVWCNPPYGPRAGSFIAKARAEVTAGTAEHVVLLLKANPDTRAWHAHVWPAAQAVVFLQGRLRFVGAQSGAPFASVVVVFDRGGRPQRVEGWDPATPWPIPGPETEDRPSVPVNEAPRVLKTEARGRPPVLADPAVAAAWPGIRAAVRAGELRTCEAARRLGVSPTWISRRARPPSQS